MLVPPKVGRSQSSVVGRVVYGTITLMSVLIVYDGWQQLRFRDVVGVIVGPSSPCSCLICSQRRWPGRWSSAER